MDRTRISSMLEGGACLQLRDGRPVQVRLARPDDAEAVQTFVRGLSDAARRLRFFSPVRELTPRMLRALTEVDGRLTRVLVAFARDHRGERIVGLAQYAPGDDRNTCELALVVADAWQGSHLGRWLIDMLLETARDAGFLRAVGDVLRGNDAMLGLARAFGFATAHNPRDATMLRITRDLDPSFPLLSEGEAGFRSTCLRTCEPPNARSVLASGRTGWLRSNRGGVPEPVQEGWPRSGPGSVPAPAQYARA